MFFCIFCNKAESEEGKGMKLFISADIEGCTGTTLVAETHNTESRYQAFAKRMTEEVVAVCEAALEAGATEIVVKDGHGDATNIDPMRMPKGVTLIRGKSGHPYNMMFGLDESFDGVLYVGYHSPAGSPESPLSHTSTGATNYITLNGKRMSEFMLNSYTAAMMNVPILFISGDDGICSLAKEMVPDITTVSTKLGCGGSTINKDPQTVIEELKEKVKEALTKDFSKGKIEMPEKFTYIANYKDMKKAYQMSFFPGVKAIDERTNSVESDNYYDIVLAHSFIVY